MIKMMSGKTSRFDSAKEEKIDVDDAKEDRMRLIHTYKMPGHSMRGIAFTPDNNFVLITDKTTILILNRRDRSFYNNTTLTGLTDAWYIAVAPNGNVVVSDHGAREVVVFESMHSGKRVATLLWYEEYFDTRPAYDCLIKRPGPLGITIFDDDKVAVCYIGQNVIGCFELDGTFLGVCNHFQRPSNIIADHTNGLVVIQEHGIERISTPSTFTKQCDMEHLDMKRFSEFHDGSTFGPAFMCRGDNEVWITDIAYQPNRLWRYGYDNSLVSTDIDIPYNEQTFLQGIATCEGERWIIDHANQYVYIFRRD